MSLTQAMYRADVGPDAQGKSEDPSLNLITFLKPEFNLKTLLEQLDRDELESFKSLLWTLPEVGDDLKTSSYKVKEASGMELAELLTNILPSSSLRPVVLQILKKMNLMQLSQILEGSQTPEAEDPVLEIIEEPLETQRADEKPGKEERQKNIVEGLPLLYKNQFWKGDEHFQYVTERSQKLIPFLSPKTATKPVPHTVILYGPAGVGKTTVARKCLQEWIQGSQGQPFKYAFYLRCRDLNHMSPCTFAELISKDCAKWKADIKEVVMQAQEVLFVVDGFDELRVPAGALIHDICGDWEMQKPVPILLSSLLKGKMVPKAKLLVTTRPQALQELFILVDQPLLLEVEGFSEQDRHAYFLKHFGDEKRALRALEAVKGNAALFRMGSAPAVCWVACVCLELQMEREADLALTCQTCTSLFLQFLCSQVPSSDFRSEQLRTSLEAICLLAAQGLWTQMSVFHDGDLWKLELKESDLSCFLNKRILQRDEDYFSFVHLSIQQLLAAIFYILKRGEKEAEDSAQRDIGDVRKLFSREERVKNPNLAQVGLFLFGLLNEQRMKELEMTFGCQTAMEIKQELLQYKLEEDRPYFSLTDLREVFACLYESQEEELVKEIMAPFEELSLHLKTSADLMYSSFCLKSCPGLHRLSIQVAKGVFLDNDIPLESYLEGMRCGFLSTELWATENRLLSLGLWTDLCSVICCNKNLSLLEINQSFLNDITVRILCDYITYASCRLQKVVIRNVSPTTTYRDLCLALIGKKTLSHLTVSGNVQESKTLTLMLLGEMLKHEKCNLAFLRLKSYSASTQQWDDFFLSFHSNQSLTCLDLTDNNLQDDSAKMLCMTLRYPRCSLKRLSLENCHLTDACCKDLSSTLMVNQRLTHLSLAKNNLGDIGVKILCEGLCYPGSKLQILVLQQCNISSHGCKYLSKLFHGDGSLTHLDLSLNPIAIGLWMFCDALRNPNFNLKFLGLWGCSLSPLYCQELASALASNQKLQTLDLGQNCLGPTGVAEILEALKDNSGPLKTLRLKIDKSNAKIQTLLKDVKENNPSLKIDVASVAAPSYHDFFEHPEIL
uniref:NACHT, LRR and PYD domains-containing protein 7 n=1 Tax=Jaculus jaculus TaxID=51337 RepID=UPI001E1B0480|nr:NACHT, LRR and PYD domains-containing protein 7 [Jaculus jaculus]